MQLLTVVPPLPVHPVPVLVLPVPVPVLPVPVLVFLPVTILVSLPVVQKHLLSIIPVTAVHIQVPLILDSIPMAPGPVPMPHPLCTRTRINITSQVFGDLRRLRRGLERGLKRGLRNIVSTKSCAWSLALPFFFKNRLQYILSKILRILLILC
jgi:hypothetical protein